VRAVAPAAGFDDQLIAGIGEQLQLVVQHARVEARKPLPVAQRNSRDHERIPLVVLAALAAAEHGRAPRRRACSGGGGRRASADRR
jgi:hypothetical protein